MRIELGLWYNVIMISKILQIKRTFDEKSRTLRDGVVFVIETEKGVIEYSVSGTEWSTRLAEQFFNVLDVQLTKEQVEKTNKLLFG